MLPIFNEISNSQLFQSAFVLVCAGAANLFCVLVLFVRAVKMGELSAGLPCAVGCVCPMLKKTMQRYEYFMK